MKKIDKLILSSFLGPFFLTFLVVVFILLTQHMLKYFDDIVGKDLGTGVLAQLFFYFAVFMTPIAIPLAVLLSSLMTFGNLGEHFELTAIKSAGISLLRALLPIFVFVLGLTVFAFYSNNYFVPKAALEAYSLLYDIKQKKPALDLKQGAFYNGIPDFSIKVNKKHSDGQSLEDIIIYDHRNVNGNKKVTLADSGTMSTIHNDRYLKLELFDGHFYFEDNNEASGSSNRSAKKETLSRSSFSQSQYVLDLSSFGLDRTDQSLFEGNRIMRNLGQLSGDVDSVGQNILEKRLQVFLEMPNAFYYHMRSDTLDMPGYLKEYRVIYDSLRLVKLASEQEEKSVTEQKKKKYQKPEKKKNKPVKLTAPAKKDPNNNKSNTTTRVPLDVKVDKNQVSGDGIIEDRLRRMSDSNGRLKDKLEKEALSDSTSLVLVQEDIVREDTLKRDSIQQTYDSLVFSLLDPQEEELSSVQTSINLARQAHSKFQSYNARIKKLKYEQNVFEIQWHKILANSVACIIMFLIGAPLGAIIKRGGLGIPVLISIIFFIVFYVISMTGEKWSKQDIIQPIYGLWAANAILLPIGLLFLRQARNDARLFEADFYNVMIEKVKQWFGKRKQAAEENK
ncbi:MAG: LptF/LptG family permease [Bacteroidota bacterium]